MGDTIKREDLDNVFPHVCQGPCEPVEDRFLHHENAEKEPRYTAPNLHRRIKSDRPIHEGECAPRDYIFEIRGVNSHRTTVINSHDEESTTSEIP